MFGLGFQELLVILAIVLVLFGGAKLPELSKNIGQTLREIRKGLSGDETDSKPKSDEKP